MEMMMLPNKVNKMVPVISDQKVERIDFGRQTPPDNWRSRRLYIQQGAEHWCNLAHHSNYPLQGHDPYDLKQNRSAALDRISISTILSLGPGDGLQDLDIVEQLRSKQPNLTYIPLDLSRILLELTIRNLGAHVHIPAGLQCDFEQIPKPLEQKIMELASCPVMFSMLGGTVGNLDLGEHHFFDRLLNLMRKDDRVLLDVPLAGPGWSPERDPRFNTERYTTEFKQFIASGLPRLKPGNNRLISFETAKKRLDCVIGNGGDIPKTKQVKIIDRLSNEIILKFCRYDWESIISWFTSRGFDILYHRCSLKNDTDIFGMGIILLGLRPS
jgi:hypothetical protein